ncbi:MAG: hypothetical protein WC728_10880 [Elusimicrobiota bacterium]
MRTLRIALILALQAAWPAGTASAFTSNAGGSAAQWLRLGAGARSAGMGEAYGPVAEGAEALYWNPAGLARLRGPELDYSHMELLRFFHHDYMAYAHPVRFLRGTVGLSFTAFYQDKLGLVDYAGRDVGSFAPHSEAVSLAYARTFEIGDNYALRDSEYFQELWRHPGATRPLSPGMEIWTGNLAAGVAIKYISETILNRNASAVAADGGVLFRPAELDRLQLGFAFRNAGTKMRFTRTRESLPVEVDFGVAYDFRWGRGKRFIPALEAAAPYYGAPFGKLGFEYAFPAWGDARAAVRAGYKSLSAWDLGPLSGATAGVGLSFKHLDLDLAFEPMNALGNVYRIGLGWRFIGSLPNLEK